MRGGPVPLLGRLPAAVVRPPWRPQKGGSLEDWKRVARVARVAPSSSQGVAVAASGRKPGFPPGPVRRSEGALNSSAERPDAEPGLKAVRGRTVHESVADIQWGPSGLAFCRWLPAIVGAVSHWLAHRFPPARPKPNDPHCRRTRPDLPVVGHGSREHRLCRPQTPPTPANTRRRVR